MQTQIEPVNGLDRPGTTNRRSWLAVLASGLLFKSASAEAQSVPSASSKRALSIMEELSELRKQISQLQSQAVSQTIYNPPVGTIMAYAGPWPPSGEKREEWEETTGWALCDGVKFDVRKYPDLHKVLGTNHLPDNRGLFLRGLDLTGLVDTGRKESEQQIGSLQLDAVGPHQHGVTVTGDNPPHEYLDYTVTAWGTPNNENDDRASGGHGYKSAEEKKESTVPTAKLSLKGTSEINTNQGTDTRPKNRAVNWIIKTR
ncbi:MAG: hypothetical protein JWM11_5311 [Planctomycetaceae bacterium]|nr:hypothetical protein [Planctomycetaceae bacterium]